MSEVKSQINVICLKNLAANIEKNTDVIVAGRRSDATEHVIFFGGDVQVLSIVMELLNNCHTVIEMVMQLSTS